MLDGRHVLHEDEASGVVLSIIRVDTSNRYLFLAIEDWG